MQLLQNSLTSQNVTSSVNCLTVCRLDFFYKTMSVSGGNIAAWERTQHHNIL